MWRIVSKFILEVAIADSPTHSLAHTLSILYIQWFTCDTTLTWIQGFTHNTKIYTGHIGDKYSQ